MEPLQVSRENFPKSTFTAEGMIVLNPPCDNFELNYEDDVIYLTRGNKKLYLQIIKPINPPEKTPLIVFIPGSAFHKQNVKERVAQLSMLAMRGYAVALLEYTPAEESPFPTLIFDAKAGIVFMKENADRFNIDKEKVFVMGDSSGAYTALMAGLTHGVESLEDEFSRDKDYKVRGIIDFYGPTDITVMNEEPSSQDHRTPDSPEGCLIGGAYVTRESEYIQRTIIKNYIDKGRPTPPVIMFHGSNDELVPFGQSCRLYNALKENGKEATLYQIENAHHGDRQFWSSCVLDIIEKFIGDNI